MSGPTEQGVDTLIGDPPRFTWVEPGKYQRQSDSKLFDLVENVVLVPIWSSCGSGFCPTAKVTGQLQIIGYAVVFVEGISGDNVIGRLLGVSSCGLMINPPDNGSSAFAVPLRLIRD
jgi:hypothetical protein